MKKTCLLCSKKFDVRGIAAHVKACCKRHSPAPVGLWTASSGQLSTDRRSATNTVSIYLAGYIK